MLPLFVLANGKIGGFFTYTAHLMRGLVDNGIQVALLKIAARDEKRPRDFGYGLQYQNISLPTAQRLVSQHGGLLACTQYSKFAEAVELLLASGAAIVLHDPTEFTKQNAPILDAIRRYESPVIVIRPVNQINLDAAGVPSRYIPHPYTRANPQRRVHRHALSLSRLDWDKHTDIIVAANERLEPCQQVDIWARKTDCTPITS